jgi:hypothetical protein
MAKKSNITRMILWNASLLIGTTIGIWSVAAVLSGLARVDWQVSELIRQYLVAIGVMQEYHTLVDFYTHIKGVEYIICIVFLGFFPAFYSIINRSKERIFAL